MRRTSVLLILLLLIAVAIGAVGCGGTSSAAAPVAGSDSPQQILNSVIAASGNLTSATGKVDVSIKLDVDATQLPDEMKKLVENPITLSATFATASNPEAADMDLTLGLAGEPLNVALKGSGTNYWVKLNNQWYEAPADMMQSVGQSDQAQAKMEEMMKLISDLGVDPATWMKDTTLIGEEKLDGVATYHVKGTPDIAKMLADVMGLMKSPEFMGMMDEAMSSAGSLGLDSMIPSPDELQQAQTEIAQVFKDFVVELWVGKDDSLPRKVTLTAQIVPPAGEATQGLNGIGITMSVLLENVNKPVTVQAPESALPYTDLEKALQENPDQFFGPLSPLIQGLGMGMGTDTGMGTTDTSAN